MNNFFLTIAASDTSGGAGIQQDIRVARDLGYWALSAVTGLTVQNFREVFRIDPVKPDLLKLQIEQSIVSFPVRVIKIGAVCSSENIEVIAGCLENSDIEHIVLDPVLFSASGSAFLPEGAVNELKSRLFSFAELVTPNKTEFEILAGAKIDTIEEGVAIAQEKCREWDTAVLLKGGHFNDARIREALITGSAVHRFERDRVTFDYAHGTGCTLSSAMACYLGKGYSLVEAYAASSAYLVKYFTSLGNR